MFRYSVGVLATLTLGLTLPAAPDRITEDDAKRAFLQRTAKIGEDELEAIRVIEAADKDYFGVLYSIKYLGVIRSIKGVPALCDNLDFKLKGDPRDRSFRTLYPASDALIAVGHPALEPLLLHIGTTKTAEKYRFLAATVVAEIVGIENMDGELERFGKKAVERKRFSATPGNEAYKSFDANKFTEFKIQVKKHFPPKAPLPKP